MSLSSEDSLPVLCEIGDGSWFEDDLELSLLALSSEDSPKYSTPVCEFLLKMVLCRRAFFAEHNFPLQRWQQQGTSADFLVLNALFDERQRRCHCCGRFRNGTSEWETWEQDSLTNGSSKKKPCDIRLKRKRETFIPASFRIESLVREGSLSSKFHCFLTTFIVLFVKRCLVRLLSS